MQFSLEAGLVLRHGKRTLEFSRELPDGEVQLEDVLTRRAHVVKAEFLIRRIMAGEYTVVLANSTRADPQSSAHRTVVVSLASLPDRHRKVVEYRYEYIRGLRASGATRGRRVEVERSIKATAARLGDSSPPSTSTVMGWARRYESSNNNISSLIDGRLFRRTARTTHALVETAIDDVLKKDYFTRARYSLTHAYEQLERKLNRMVKDGQIDAGNCPSYSTLARRVRDVDLYQRIASREGASRARYVCRTSFPDGHPSYPMERVEIDHTPLNWVVLCDRTGLPLGRPILSVAIDAYSGYVLGFYLSFYGPGLTSVVGAMRHSIMPKTEITKEMNLANPWLSHGVGDEWVIDNGLEFHSFGFKQMAMALAVDLMYCRVRTPWLKPRVERFFGTLNTLTLLKGRVTKPMANAVRMDPYKDAAISFTDLVVGLVQFFVDVHPFQENKRKLATPYDLFSEGVQRCPPASYPGSLDELKLAAAHTRKKKLTAGGLELLGLPYGSVDFGSVAKRHGTGVEVLLKFDPDDISTVYVQEPDSRQWFAAHCRWHEYAKGLSLNQHELIRKFDREKIRGDGRREALLAAKQRLHEHWMGATGGRNRSGALLAGRFANLTSAKVMGLDVPSDMGRIAVEPCSQSPLLAAPDHLVTPQESIIEISEIPDFESFSLRR